MKQLIFNNRTIHFSDQGSGKTLVLVHGFCEDLRMWDTVKTAIDGYRIVTIDLPGFGQSEPLLEASVEAMAESLKAVIDYLQIEKFILLGHSMGGYVSLAFAERYGEHLEAFGMIHSHPYADTAESQSARNRSIQFIQDNGHTVYTRQLISKLFPAEFTRQHPDIVNQLSERASGYPAEGIIGGLQAMRNRPDRSTILQQLSIPVLMIIGEEDFVIPPLFSMEQTALPSIADINILEGIGHMLMFEDPDRFQQLINNFLVFCAEWINYTLPKMNS